jgi:hypothetical protein
MESGMNQLLHGQQEPQLEQGEQSQLQLQLQPQEQLQVTQLQLEHGPLNS